MLFSTDVFFWGGGADCTVAISKGEGDLIKQGFIQRGDALGFPPPPPPQT